MSNGLSSPLVGLENNICFIVKRFLKYRKLVSSAKNHIQASVVES